MGGTRLPTRRTRAWVVVVLLALVGSGMVGFATTVSPPGHYVISVQETDPAPDAIPFPELSDRDQRAFLADLNGETVRLESPPDLEPNAVVRYEGNHYLVRVGHAETLSPVPWIVGFFGGTAALVLAGLGGILLLTLAARDRIVGPPS